MKKKTARKTASSSQTKTAESMPSAKGNMGSCVCASCPSSHCGGWGLAFLRIVVGAIFISFGWPKIFGAPELLGFAGWVGSLVGVVEVLAGLALIIGIWVRWASYLLAIIMVVAIVFAKKFGWPASALDLTLLASVLTLAWNGPGKWSLHDKCNCCCN